MTDFDELLGLYLDGFPEDGEAVARRFLEKLPPGSSFTVRIGGRAVSAGHLVPKRAAVCGREVRVGYLSALSTRRDFRGRGLISAVVKDILRECDRRGYPFAALCPFDEDYYHKYGFVTAMRFTRVRFCGGGSLRVTAAETPSDFRAAAEFFVEQSESSAFRQLLSPHELAEYADDLSVDGSKLLLVRDGDRPVALAVSECGELTYCMTSCADKLAAAVELAQYRSFPYFSASGRAYLQLRPTNIREILSSPVYRERGREYRFVILDDIIAANSGEYLVRVCGDKITCEKAENACGNTCEEHGTAAEKPQAKQPASGAETYCFTAAELTEAMLAGKGPFIPLTTHFMDKY